MRSAAWQLQTPISAIIFDVDGTLSKLEGINYLAALNGVGDEVEALTNAAMSKIGINPSIYQKRLSLTHPTLKQLNQLGEEYYINRTEDSAEVMKLLLRLQKHIYLLTAGLYPAVEILANKFHIPSSHIHAVHIKFDNDGHYLDFDHQSLLIHNDGKKIIAEQLKEHHHRILHVGDGMNDLSSMNMVNRFVGYGGAYYREKMELDCPYYIKSASLTPLIPLSLTLKEYEALTVDEKTLYQKGLEFIEAGEVKIRTS